MVEASKKGPRVVTARQYRAKAVEFGELVKTSTAPDQRRDFKKLEQSFKMLADNAQWLADNHQHTVHAAEPNESERSPEQKRPADAILAEEEKHVLRCLGAALIMRWNTLPVKLQRELFDKAGSVDEPRETATLRGQIARFLHAHKNDENCSGNTLRAGSTRQDASLHVAAIARWDDEGGALQAPGTAKDANNPEIPAVPCK